MAELALYRKYRSHDFSEVIGQPQVVQVLTNAINSGRTSHAYLFTGPRGVGKTSVARLLARSLNCTGKAKPCNQCNSCLAPIGASLDLIEIDAASNRGIDEIRQLKEKISLAPSVSRHKVYIIDEVHMLTEAAFNALLKTLEEPPEHAVFILATTEAHKLPETIISRTQRFNFKPIAAQDMRLRLRKIADAEKIKIDDEALMLLAEASRGGFRDAISMLDQIAGSADSINADQVRLVLGWADHQSVQQLSQALEAGQAGQALAVLDQLASHGVQTSQIIYQLISHFRRQLLQSLQSGNQAGIARQVTIVETLANIHKSAWPELALETAVIKLTTGLVSPEAKATPASAPVPSIDQQPSKPPVQPEPPKAVPPKVAAKTTGNQPELWLKALVIIQQQNNSLAAVLKSCQISFEGEQIVVNCRFSFYRDRLNEPKNRQIIEQATERAYGHHLPVRVQLEMPANQTAAPQEELVSSALEILGGEIIDG